MGQKKLSQLNKSQIRLTEQFLKRAFQKNPKFSYNDWRVTYEHSVDVKNLAIKIANKVKGDPFLSALAGLLHDIGKTYKAPKAFLELHAHDLNTVVSKPLFAQLGLTNSDLTKLKGTISYKRQSKEMKIMMDADALAFFKDKRLHSLFFKWAIKHKKTSSLKRHVAKYKNLNFKYSKQIGKQWFEKMVKEWQSDIQHLL